MSSYSAPSLAVLVRTECVSVGGEGEEGSGHGQEHAIRPLPGRSGAQCLMHLLAYAVAVLVYSTRVQGWLSKPVPQSAVS